MNMGEEKPDGKDLSNNLKRLAVITEWFDEQEDVDVEEGLKKVKEAVALIKASKERLKGIENEFEEIKKEIEIEKEENWKVGGLLPFLKTKEKPLFGKSMEKVTATLETAFLIIAVHGFIQKDWVEVLLAVSLSAYVLYTAAKKWELAKPDFAHTSLIHFKVLKSNYVWLFTNANP